MKKPTITGARRIAEQHGAHQVAILLFDRDVYYAVSYGRTRAACDVVGQTLDAIVARIDDGTIPAPVPSRAGRVVEHGAPREAAGGDATAQARAILAELERDQPADDEEWTISTGALRELLKVTATRAVVAPTAHLRNEDFMGGEAYTGAPGCVCDLVADVALGTPEHPAAHLATCRYARDRTLDERIRDDVEAIERGDET